MIEQLDKQIADLEARLADLRRQKLTALQAQVAALQASITGAPAPARPADAPRRGRPRKDASPAPALVTATGALPPLPVVRSRGPKKRGRRPGKRIPDDVLLEQIRVLVTAAGAGGISAREVSARTQIFYPKVIKLMKPVFKASGKGKWTRYTVK